MTYEERLFYVTRNLISYKEYGNDVLKASRVVKKYFKEKPTDECERDLRQTMQIYQAGIEFVQVNKDEYRKSTQQISIPLQKAEGEFIAKYPETTEGLLRYMLLEIFNWYHER